MDSISPESPSMGSFPPRNVHQTLPDIGHEWIQIHFNYPNVSLLFICETSISYSFLERKFLHIITFSPKHSGGNRFFSSRGRSIPSQISFFTLVDLAFPPPNSSLCELCFPGFFPTMASPEPERQHAPESPPAEKRIEQMNMEDPETAMDHAVVGKPWMYKPMIKIGNWEAPWFASPEAQLILVSCVCFLCPGMFNAVSGLGGGGQVNATDVNNSNTALYSTFAVVGFFAGSIANRIGLRLTLSLGGFGYFLYVAALLSYNINQNAGFLIFAGALLGVCAGLLWCAQGAVMMSYPHEHEKGKYIAVFWVIFNLGGVIGSLIPLGQNMHSTAGKVDNGTYIAFLVLMAVGFALCWVVADSKYIKRKDGSRIIVIKNPTWKSEFLGLWETLRSDSYIVLMFPMFLASNWFYGYHFNSVNLAYFTVRTRALNSLLYWLMQMVGAFIFGQLLDMKCLSRPARAKVNFGILLAITMGIWGGGYVFQKQYTRATVKADTDFMDSGYIGPMFLYMFYGFYDAAFQTCTYW